MPDTTPSTFAPRLWLGVRNELHSPQAFKNKLAESFIAATAVVMRPLGLVGYVPALLPFGKPVGVVDEMALVVYASTTHYKAAQKTPVGSIYGSAHRDAFAKTSESIEITAHGGVTDTKVAYLAELEPHASPNWGKQTIWSLVIVTDQAMGGNWRNAWSQAACALLAPTCTATAHYAYCPSAGNVLYAWLVLDADQNLDLHLRMPVVAQVLHAQLGRSLDWHWLTKAQSTPVLGTPFEPISPMPLAWGESLQMQW